MLSAMLQKLAVRSTCHAKKSLSCICKQSTSHSQRKKTHLFATNNVDSASIRYIEYSSSRFNFEGICEDATTNKNKRRGNCGKTENDYCDGKLLSFNVILPIIEIIIKIKRDYARGMLDTILIFQMLSHTKISYLPPPRVALFF